MSAVHYMPMRSVDRYIFDAVLSGRKKVETRASGPKYQNIKKGDIIEFRCGKDKFQKTVGQLRKFKTIARLLKKYSLKNIAPWLSSVKELEKLVMGFPGYPERIKKHGLIAFELK